MDACNCNQIPAAEAERLLNDQQRHHMREVDDLRQRLRHTQIGLVMWLIACVCFVVSGSSLSWKWGWEHGYMYGTKEGWERGVKDCLEGIGK